MRSTSLTSLFLLSLSSLSTLAAAHFKLDFPAARGFDEDNLVKFPCGGQNTVSSNRTAWPLSGGSIQLTMGHSQAKVQVLLAVGNDPSDNFNVVLRPTFQEMGLGNFCMGDVNVPAGLNISEGTNATIQVVTNGDPNGGLYNCADITFTSTDKASPSQCLNGTGVTSTPLSGANINANGSSSSSSGSTTSTGTGTSTSATASPTNAAGRIMWEGWGIIAGAAVGAAVLL
ncbi:hypothetical protein L228DRAFT_270121 [Xylona heveae TC161]|uniref:Copper acquisition factor BIM1-like domain-containing protein n=1 Tax=Xylona heveae (strain CBS 132557 / TC161) TaxID=1328760 RepID=A0A165FD69_XYLHT|nr:hypothetical protein L228DRAFT_270121 [Xylona heveae TC161]KZF20846.1 hypothetical protein L228DRAFT_270121 [Xylona heveae TC161]